MEWPYLRHRQKNIYETGAHLWAIFVTRAFPNLINPSVTTHGEFDVTRTSLALNLYPSVVLFCVLNQQRRKKQTSFLICIPVIAYSPLRLIITLWVHVCVKRGRAFGEWVCDNQQLFQILCFLDLAQGSSIEGRRNGHTRGNSSPGITTQTEGKWKSFVLTLADPSCISKFLLPPILPLQLFNEIGVHEISASSPPLWCAIKSLAAFFRTAENFEYSWTILYETLPRSYSGLLMCNVDRGPMKHDN